MPRLCVGILARDNETDIAACLNSVDWADERLVILDTRSQDQTDQIARALGARVVPHHFEDFGRQREFGLSLPQAEWLFYVDSDERGSPALGEEIRRATEDPTRVGWWVPRRNMIWGQEIRHGGWFPDYQLRLLKVGHAHYDMTRQVHEIVHLDGPEGFLREPLIHHNYATIGQFVAKQQEYIAYEVEILYREGIHPRPYTYVLQPLREFYRRYIRLQGYRDGVAGLLLCALVAYYYGFRVTWQLGRLRRAQDGREEPTP